MYSYLGHLFYAEKENVFFFLTSLGTKYTNTDTHEFAQKSELFFEYDISLILLNDVYIVRGFHSPTLIHEKRGFRLLSSTLFLFFFHLLSIVCSFGTSKQFRT